MTAILKENLVGDDLIIDPSQPTTSKTRIIGQGQQLLRLDEEEKWEGSKTLRERLLRKFENNLEKGGLVILSDYNKGV